MTLQHVSDTARWVAVYRAMETERPDAIFRDPFARKLAGPEGERIVREVRSGRAAAWAMIVRTAVFDELIRAAVLDGGVDRVVNLAAGLDARPWRMDLPEHLAWVDVDLPGILDHKLELLHGEQPRFGYRALRADLTDGEACRRALADATDGAQRTLVVTEGLLIYLAPEQVGALAQDIHRESTARSWIIDIASPRLLKWMSRTWGKTAERGNAPFRFAPAEGTAFFEPFGWKEAAFRSSGEEGHRLRREMRGAWLWRSMLRLMSAERREETRRMAGTVLLERVDG